MLEILVEGLSIAFIGILVVTLVLYIISLILSMLKFSSAKPVETAKTVKAEPPTKPAEPEIYQLSDDITPETVAVITAALAHYLNKQDEPVRILSLRRVAPWNEAAKKEQQKRFF